MRSPLDLPRRPLLIPPRPGLRPTRRAVVGALAGAPLGLAAGLDARRAVAQVAPPHEPFGPVTPPVAAPPLVVARDDGAAVELPRLLRGRTTAVQLVFTRCTATCPIQAALFAGVARRLRRPDAQLLSLSIDPAHDRPAALRAWLARFAAPARWRAAAPREEDVDRLLDFFRGRATGADRHTARVYLFDREARLVFRTAELPTAAHVVDAMDEVARRA